MDEWQEIDKLVLQLRSFDAITELDRGDYEHLEDQLFQRLSPHVRFWVAKYLRGSPQLIEDAKQEALHNIFKGLGTYDPNRGSFQLWAFQVTINAVKRFLHSEYRRNGWEIPASVLQDPYDEEEIAFLDQVSDPSPLVDVILANKQILDTIFEIARTELNEEEFLAWKAWGNETPYERIAQILDIRPDHARQLVHRARRKVSAGIMLHPRVLSNESIESALKRCMDSTYPLTDEELNVFRQCVLDSPRRTRPPYRKTEVFRAASMKVLVHVTIG